MSSSSSRCPTLVFYSQLWLHGDSQRGAVKGTQMDMASQIQRIFRIEESNV